MDGHPQAEGVGALSSAIATGRARGRHHKRRPLEVSAQERLSQVASDRRRRSGVSRGHFPVAFHICE
eukprot:7593769-Pyramimonas_sp.AAC.1